MSAERPDGPDAEQFCAWSISAGLAAVPDSYLATIPEDLAVLIREAKALHPAMAEGARKRERERD